MRNPKASFLRFLSVCVLSTLAQFPLSAVAEKVADNLLTNGDFKSGVKGWISQSVNEHDSQVAVSQGVLSISRKLSGYFLRVHQDVAIKKPGYYSLNFDVMSNTSRSQNVAWIIMHGVDGKWMEDKIIYINIKNIRDQWKKNATILQVPVGVDQVRINLGAKGNKSKVLFKNVKFTWVRPIRTPDGPIPVLTSNELAFDGVLDDPVWSQALLLDNFKVLGIPRQISEDKTEVRVLATHDNLYLAFNVHGLNDSKAGDEKGIGFFSQNEVEVFLSPDRKRYVHLAVSRLGAKYGKYQGYSQHFASGWWQNNSSAVADSSWKMKVKENGDGWTAEVSIPLNLVYEKGQSYDSIFMNFCRHRPQSKHPYSNWAGVDGEIFHVPKQFPLFKFTTKLCVKNSDTDAMRKSWSLTKRLSMPDLMFVGKPLKVAFENNYVEPPSTITYSGDFRPDPVLEKQLAKWLIHGTGIHYEITHAKLSLDDIAEVTKSSAYADRMKNSEAFKLIVEKGRIVIKSLTRNGYLRGLATITMLIKNEYARGLPRVPVLTVWDAPGFAVRGWQLGSRDPQKLKQQIDLLFLMRCNTVIFELSSYGQTVPFPFESIPEISDQRFTKEEWSDLADYARARGVEPIPLFYSWARCGFLLNRDKYANLAECPDERKGKRSGRVFDRNFSPLKKESAEITFKLLDEIIDVMKLKKIHVGLDEIQFDSAYESKEAVDAGKKKLDWILDVARMTDAHLRGKSVEMWMYADCLDPKQNGHYFGVSSAKDFDSIPKDVVLQDWKYRPGKHDSVAMFTNAGYKTVVSCWKSIAGLSDLIRDAFEAGAAGHVGTSWSNTEIPRMRASIATMINCAAYLGWSPQLYDLSKFKFIPNAAFGVAVDEQVFHGKVLNSIVVAPPASAMSQKDVLNALGLPVDCGLAFLNIPIASRTGLQIKSFKKDGKPVGVVLDSSKKACEIPINAEFKEIALLHALNSYAPGEMYKVVSKHLKAHTSIVNITFNYADGSEKTIPSVLRDTVTWCDDPFPCKSSESVVFGTLNNQRHINISLLSLPNPYPNKKVSSLSIAYNGGEGVKSYVLFGAAYTKKK